MITTLLFLALQNPETAAGECTALVTSEERREQNAHEREERIKKVYDLPSGIDILYEGGPLAQPKLAHARHLTIQGIKHDEDALVAVVHRDECTYLLGVDDDLLPGYPIRAVFDAGVLVEDDDALFFVPAGDDVQMPVFRLIWVSSFTIRYEEPWKPSPVRRTPPNRRGRR